MQFVLIPFALCFLLYIRQENQYRFRAATALKITLTMSLTLCLAVALARRFSPVLLTAAVGMLLCAGGDFYLQYIRRDVRKFTKGIVLFGLGQLCNIAAQLQLAAFHWSAAAALAGLLTLAIALKGIGQWNTSANDPWLTIYTVLVATTAAKSLSTAIVLTGTAGGYPVGSRRTAVLPVGHGAGDLELSKAPHPAGGPELAAVFCRAIYAVRRIYRGGPIKNAPTSVSDVGAIWGMMGVDRLTSGSGLRLGPIHHGGDAAG